MSVAMLRLDIVSAEREIFSGEVEMVFATGESGELGIHPGHAPLLSFLKTGNIRATLSDKTEEIFYISGGMIEIQPSMVTVLADTVVRANDIDEAAALEAKEEALRKIANQNSKLDLDMATVELAEAIAQVRAVQDIKRRARR
jgi:F-type H+-transporting ATPase subunit epsilon